MIFKIGLIEHKGGIMGGFKKNTKATRVYKKFTHSWSQDIYESNKSSWTLIELDKKKLKTLPHIKLKMTSNYDLFRQSLHT